MSKASDNQIDQILAAQEQLIEYLAFSGGGAKGAGYSGVHSALVDSGMLAAVKVVAGSSAGSISAAVIASGISKEEYYRLSQNTNMKGLLGEEGILINKDGTPLFELIASTVQNNVSTYLNNVDIPQIVERRWQQVKAEQQELNQNSANTPEKELIAKNQELQKQIDKLEELKSTNCQELIDLQQKSNNVGKITFRDLDLLRTINPEKFKGLIVTATRKDNGELTIFNATDSPDIEIAHACRASASIPIVFRPHSINGVEYVDGGYRDNIPLRYFSGKELKIDKDLGIEDISDDPAKVRKARQEGRTMAFAFGGDMQATANVAIYSAKEKIVDPGRVIAFLTDVVFKMLSKVGGKFKYSEEENKVHDELRKNALNTVVLDTGEVGTLSFDKAQEKAEYLHTKGYLQTMEYMNNHQLGTSIDHTLGHKNFILTVYEESCKQSLLQSWSNKIIGGHSEKTHDILSFCKEEVWLNKAPEQILSDLVITAATKRTDNSLSTNTTTMNKLIGKLNDSYTPEKVRRDFIELLSIDTHKDPRFDQNKTISANLVNFKFEAKDFAALLNKRQESIKDNETKSFADKYNKKETSIKSYIQAGKEKINQKKSEIFTKKEGKKSDIVKEEINKPEIRSK